PAGRPPPRGPRRPPRRRGDLHFTGGRGSQRSDSPTSLEIFFASHGRWMGMMNSPAPGSPRPDEPSLRLPVEKKATRRPSGLHAAYVLAPSCWVSRRTLPPLVSV